MNTCPYRNEENGFEHRCTPERNGCTDRRRRSSGKSRTRAHGAVALLLARFQTLAESPSGKKRRVGWIPSPRPKTTVAKTVVSDCGPRTAAHEAGASFSSVCGHRHGDSSERSSENVPRETSVCCPTMPPGPANWTEYC